MEQVPQEQDPLQEISKTAEKIEAPAARASLFFDFGKTALEKGDIGLAEKTLEKIEHEALRKQLQSDIEKLKASAQ